MCESMLVKICESVSTYAVAAISASHEGRLPVIITRGSCNCLLAFAVNLELINSDLGNTGFAKYDGT